MAWGYFNNGLKAFVIIITYVFAKPSIEDSLDDTTGFVFYYIFQKATSTSIARATRLTAIILLPVIFSKILFNASTSRQTFASARDQGLPFANWIGKVDAKRDIPVNAIALSYVIS
ncbi:Amino acid/polyamine transporter I [Penicillium italicum]|uniref:Amino acid/polyamine transporter I n=1 Tax=Penicillium italicum TaxID=40296 RepID=A0A0A2L3N9_PENIT|nr:Amino acid/polyamine transporter I [Penicillium italicum]